MKLNKHHAIIATATAGLACIIAYYKYSSITTIENKVAPESKVDEVLQGEEFIKTATGIFSSLKSKFF
jgi:hypothetical protein